MYDKVLESESIKQKQLQLLTASKMKNIIYDGDLKKWELKPKNNIIDIDIIPLSQNKLEMKVLKTSQSLYFKYIFRVSGHLMFMMRSITNLANILTYKS